MIIVTYFQQKTPIRIDLKFQCFGILAYLSTMNIGFDAKRIFYNRTGLGNYARATTQALVQHYPENTYHLFSPGKPHFANFLSQQKQVHTHLPSGFLAKKFPSVWRSNWLTNDLQKADIDIYHGLSNELPKGIEHTNIKSVVTIHDLIFMHYPKQYPWLDRQMYHRKFESAILRADLIIAASEHTQNDILHNFECDPNKVKVLYQSCNPLFAVPIGANEKEALLSKYQLRPHFILSVGTIEKRKNHISLVKAFKEGYFPNNDLVIVGKKADAYAELQAYVKANHLESRVKFIFNLPFEDLPGMYQLAKVFAYLSTYEGFGIPVLEALHSGTAVIASNVSSIPEVAGNAAILLDPMNVAQIGNSLQDLILHPQKAATLHAQTPAHLKQFDPAVLSEKLMHYYKELLAQKQ